MTTPADAAREWLMDRETMQRALQKLREDSLKPKPHSPPPFIGLSGVGFVCRSEYNDIVNRTGLYAKGAPLDLGDAWYAAQRHAAHEGGD